MSVRLSNVAWLGCVLLALGATVTAPQRANADEGQVLSDRWYVLSLQGQRMGWMHDQVRRNGDQLVTTNETNMSLSRGPLVINVVMSSAFTETVDGRPLEAWSIQNLASIQKTVRAMRFGEDEIELITGEGTQQLKKKVPYPDESWLPPAAAGRYLVEQAAKGAKQISRGLMDPSMGTQVVEEKWQYQKDENVEVLGKVVPATLWKVTMSSMPSMVTNWYLDPQGHTVKTTLIAMPGMPMEIVLADEQLARQQVDPPELLMSTLVEPDRRIAGPRRLRSAIYELSFTKPQGAAEFSPKLPRGGSQRVVWGDNRTARVVVDLDEPVNPIDDLPGAAHREATAMLNSEDPKIRQLVGDALRREGRKLPVARRAERIRRFVHGYISAKDLSVGFATASEVARTRQGDCTEHAVLLAAMLRAADIPSRTVSGLIYVDQFAGRQGIFGYHMWAQAWYGGDAGGGRWVDLDATLDDDTPFDAAHIALARSVLSDDTVMNDMVNMAPMLGRLSVRVIDTGSGR